MEAKFERLVQQVLENGYSIEDDFLPKDLYEQLVNNLTYFIQNGKLKAAGIGKEHRFQVKSEIRSDSIFWLDEGSTLPSEIQFFDVINAFTNYLNYSCYTGIKNKEFHYAQYEKGSFYRKHLDQFKSNGDRLYTLILYLNNSWKEGDGGELIIYLNDEKEIKITPIGGRVVFFKSNEILHEVLQSNTNRMSITGWLKR